MTAIMSASTNSLSVALQNSLTSVATKSIVDNIQRLRAALGVRGQAIIYFGQKQNSNCKNEFDIARLLHAFQLWVQ